MKFTYTTSDGAVGYLNMNGEPIPFDVNPGPVLHCAYCQTMTYGAELRHGGCGACLHIGPIRLVCHNSIIG